MNDIATAPALLSNNPPLAETLTEDTLALRQRRDALLASVAASHIETPENAASVTTLGGMLQDLRVKAEEARKAAAKPFDEGKAAVQTAYAREILDPLDKALRQCRAMLDQWRERLATIEREEQSKRDAEAAIARAAAEEAERRRLEAQTAGDTGAAIKAEIEEVQARDRAAALEADQGTIRPSEPIRTQTGTATAATQRVPVVTNLRTAFTWLAKNQGAALIEAITPLIARLVRAKVTIPGVEVREETTTRFRRS